MWFWEGCAYCILMVLLAGFVIGGLVSSWLMWHKGEDY